MPDVEHLSSLDANFLHFESAEMPMHIGSVHVLELPPGYDGDVYEAVKAHVAGRMHLAEAFTRKLARVPFDLSNPVWVEDEDIDHHVRHVLLPRPGTWAQLERLVGRLHSQLLDRSRPLWEITLIEGLESGERVLYTKAHHAGIDGQAGVALGRALLDPEPNPKPPRKPRPRRLHHRYQLGIAELAGAAFSNSLRQSIDVLRSVPAMAKAAAKLLLPVQGEDGRRRWLSEGGRLLAPRTPFNLAITNQRSWAARTVPLDPAKAIAKASRKTKSSLVDAVSALPTDVPLLGAPWLMSGLASLYGRSRLANVLPQPANVVISNVSGSPLPVATRRPARAAAAA